MQHYATSYRQLIEIEATGFNSTLAPGGSCPNANNNAQSGPGVVLGFQWAQKYTVSAIQRLQPSLQGMNLTALNIVAMQSACAYEVCGTFGIPFLTQYCF